MDLAYEGLDIYEGSSIDCLKAAVGHVAFFFWLAGWFYGV
jgi:hypothetical protein